MLYKKEYLNALNIPCKKPSYQYLKLICHAYLNTFPFENISKLIFYRDKNKFNSTIPCFESFIKNYQKYHFGGTCYSLNANLLRLLTKLGFECYHIMLGNEHMAIVVKINNERYYVDCGAAAPFFEPVPFETDERYIAKFGNDQIQLLPAEGKTNEYQYIRFTSGKQNGKIWIFDSRQSYSVEDFKNIIMKSNQPGASFMELLRCQIYQTDKQRSLSLVNNKFGIRYENGDVKLHTLTSVEEIEDVISNKFKLHKLPVKEAITILKDLGTDIFANKI